MQMGQSVFFTLVEKLETQLLRLKAQTHDFVELSESAIGLCDIVMDTLRKEVLQNGFESDTDEIYFFKHIKPRVNSKLFFYTEVFDIESSRPEGGKKLQVKFLQDKSKEICNYLNANKAFHQYYKRSRTDFDHIYFIRGNVDSRIHKDSIHAHANPKFSTGYDYTLAKIMAYEQLKKYIRNEIRKLKGNEEFVSNLYWTNPNIDALEIVYSLFLAKAINNGKASRIEIARAFEKMFNIKFKDIYGTFKEMRGRSEQITFLNHLIEILQKRMDDMDE